MFNRYEEFSKYEDINVVPNKSPVSNKSCYSAWDTPQNILPYALFM